VLIIESMPPVSSNKSQPKYAKNAKVGETVHSKAVHVTAEAQCKHWYGRLWKEKWVLGVLQNIKKKPVNGQNQCFYEVEYTLLDRSTMLLPLQDIHCCPGKWTDTTPTPAAPLYGINMPKKDLGSVDMLEAPSIQHSDNSTFDESQAICELFPDSEPVPAPVLEEQVPTQQAMEQAKEEQVQSDDDSDDASDIKPSVTTDNIPWYTEMEYHESDINGTVSPIKWSFKDEMGEDMSEDDDVGSEQSVLDYCLACFPPNAMKHILYLTNKKLEEDEQPEMGMGELLNFFGVLILIM
jgi:hypothetical protein